MRPSVYIPEVWRHLSKVVPRRVFAEMNPEKLLAGIGKKHYQRTHAKEPMAPPFSGIGPVTITIMEHPVEWCTGFSNRRMSAGA